MGQADQALAYCRAQIGKPYVFGTQGPDTFDCSGLVKAAYNHAVPPVDLVHYTGTMLLEGVEVSKSDLQIGDLVFPDPGHVQLYAGDGQVIEAPHTGAFVRQVPMYGFWRARRVATDGQTPSGFGPISANLAVSPLDIPGAITTSFRDFAKTFATLSSPHFWYRAAIIATGVTVVLFGLIVAFRRQEINAVKTTLNTAAGLGATATGAAVGRVASERAAASKLAQPKGFARGGTGHIGAPATQHHYTGRHRATP